MSLFSKLFGGGSSAPTAKTQAEEYDGFRITPEPMSDGGGHRICARIEKEIDGETKSHMMIRADVCQSADEATSISMAKAKILIDQQGDRLFG